METKDLDVVPDKPGVYIWKDSLEGIIYIGKAKFLKKRMKQYFCGMLNSYKTQKLVNNINSFDYIVTSNEKEALILEQNLINKHKPEYNILLTDDKRYPYIKISLKDTLTISLQRRYKKTKNSFFYGPFPIGEGAGNLKKLLEREAFFERGLPVNNKNYAYWESVFLKLQNILKFNNKTYIKKLKREMYETASKLQFEIANDLKNSITFLSKINQSQNMKLKNYSDYDVVGFQEENGLIFIAIMIYRFGSLLLIKNFTVDLNQSKVDTIREFLNQYYVLNLAPQNIVLDLLFQKIDFWFNSKFIFPQKGKFQKILHLANINANQRKEIKMLQHKRKKDLTINGVEQLQFMLNIKKINTIMMLDNSHNSNTNIVSTYIVYKNGVKDKSKYKKYNLSSGQRSADVDYMKQSVTRYFTKENYFKPDLFIVDGGIQQYNEVKKILNTLGINLNLISLVKNEKHVTKELIDLGGKQVKIQDSFLLSFLREVQKEVDRFSKSHYRKRSSISTLESSLTLIKGIGFKTEKKLLEHFKTYSAIYNATLKELEKITNKNNALKIKENYQNIK